MIKKISAIVLALVLCLSVVVVPTSALDLGDKGVAFELKWDKDAYSAGETATLSIFMKVSEDYEIGTGSLLIGLNSAVINQTDNDAADIKDSMVASDLWTSFWKVPSNSAAWLASTVASKVTTANTAEEQALYDHYFKITISRDTSGSGSHENSTDLKRGLPGADFNALADAGEPILQLSFVVADGVADGTAINAGITSGSASCSPAQTAFKYIKTPGSASTTANVPAASFGTAIATATVGEEATVELAMATWKQQIKFGVDKDGAYNDTFSARTFVEFTNFSEVFDDAADALNTDDGDGLLEVGFVYKVGDFDEATAKGYVEAGVVAKDGPKEMTDDGYTVDRRAYVSTTAKAGGYVMGSTIADIPAADKTTNVTVLAYAKYTTGGEPVYVYHPVSGTFETLYNTYYSQAFPG